MAQDYSWIDPLLSKSKGLFGLDPEQAAKGANLQAERAYNEAKTADTVAHTTKIIPATLEEIKAKTGVHTATAGKLGAETEGITFKNKGAKDLHALMSDPNNWVKAPDGRMIPDANKIHSLLAASSAAAGEKGVKDLPGILGGYNLNLAPLSPGANLAAGGANATAGQKMLEPLKLNPDQTIIQKNSLTGGLMLPGAGSQVPAAPAVPARPSFIPAATFNPPSAPAFGNPGVAGGTLVDVNDNQRATLSGILAAGNADGFGKWLNNEAKSNPATLNSSFNNEIPAGTDLSGAVNGAIPGAANILAPQNAYMNNLIASQPAQEAAPANGGVYTAPPSQTQLQVADKKSATELAKTKADNEAKAERARAEGATKEEVARIRAGGVVEAAKVRKSGYGTLPGMISGSEGGTPGQGVYAPIDVNRLNEHTKDAMGAVTNALSVDGRAINSNDAAIIAAAAVKAYPGVPAAEAVNTYIARSGITTEKPMGWGNMRILQGGQPLDIQGLRTATFGAETLGPKPMGQAQPAATPGVVSPPSSPSGATAGTQAQPSNTSQPAAQPQGAPTQAKEPIKFTSGGVEFTEGSAGQTFTHGEQRLVYPKDKSGNVVQGASPTPMYYNEDTGKFQTEEPGSRFAGNETTGTVNYGGKVASPVLNDYVSVRDGGYNHDEAEKRLVSRLEANGLIDSKKYFSIKGMRKRAEYIKSPVDELVAIDRKSKLGDPRIDKFANGDLGEVAMPREAMQLAEELGINREAYGIPKVGATGFGQSGLGMLLAPWEYGPAGDAMKRNLPAFFRAVQNGSFDPRTLKIDPSQKAGLTGKSMPTGLGPLMTQGNTEAIGATPTMSLSPHQIAAIEKAMSKGSYNTSTDDIEEEAARRSGKKKPERGNYRDKPLPDMPNGILATPSNSDKRPRGA